MAKKANAKKSDPKSTPTTTPATPQTSASAQTPATPRAKRTATTNPRFAGDGLKAAREKYRAKWTGKSRGEKLAMKFEHVARLMQGLVDDVNGLPVEHVEDALVLASASRDSALAAAEKVRKLPANYKKPGGFIAAKPLVVGEMSVLRDRAIESYTPLLTEEHVRESFKVISIAGKFATVKTPKGSFPIAMAHLKRPATAG